MAYPTGHRVGSGYTSSHDIPPPPYSNPQQYTVGMYWYPMPPFMGPPQPMPPYQNSMPMQWPPAPYNPWMHPTPQYNYPIGPPMHQPGTSTPAGAPPAPPKPKVPIAAKLPGGLMPGSTLLLPKSWTYIHVFHKNTTITQLNNPSTRPLRKNIYKVPTKTTVKEFLEMLGGDKDCEICEIFELGGGRWVGGKKIGFGDERGKKDLEGLGWGGERGGKGGKPVYVVWGKVDKKE